jgi:hypothetical protein
MHYPWTFDTVAQVFSQLPQVEWILGVASWFDARGGPRAVSSASGAFNVYDILAGNYRWIQQESVFWRRGLWERAGGQLDQSLTCAADFDLWLRFFRLAPLYYVPTLLGGFRVHGNRLGDTGNGLYEREARRLHSRFVASYDRRSRARAGLIRLLGPTGSRIIGDRLNKAGILPWYSHPRAVFEGERVVSRRH